MANKLSAGLLLHRTRSGSLEVLLVHPGGPFWAHKDAGAWSIPKGEHEIDEDPFEAAKREFGEELGAPAPLATYYELGRTRLTSGKTVTVWAAEAEFDASAALSNTFEMEWPRGSGRVQSFAEVDRAEWFGLEEARTKVSKGQLPFLDRLEALRAEPIA